MATIELNATTTQAFDVERHRSIVKKAIAKKSFATLATSSGNEVPHVVGVVYAAAEGDLYINAYDMSIKVRNVRQNPRVAVCIPVRKLPVGPPYVVQFQGAAEILDVDDPRIARLHHDSLLKRVTSHGELETPGTCFIRVTPGKRVSTHGLGVPLLDMIRRPFDGMRSIEW